MRIATDSRKKSAGFTLVEVLMVVAIMSIVAGIMLISTGGLGAQILDESTAVLSGDLLLARDAALSYGTEYTVTFNLSAGTYAVSHTGSGSPPPLERPLSNGSNGNFTVALGSIHPGGATGVAVSIYRIRTAVSNQDVTTVTFNSRGNTGPARSEDTIIWLAQGTGSDIRYQKITISWITGQVWTSAVQSAP